MNEDHQAGNTGKRLPASADETLACVQPRSTSR
jgi:hypothetical protein